MNTVKRIINEWDPIQLLALAPSDEYDYEIHQIEIAAKEAVDVESLAKVIYNIFAESFGFDIFKKTIDVCTIIANKILQSSRSL